MYTVRPSAAKSPPAPILGALAHLSDTRAKTLARLADLTTGTLKSDRYQDGYKFTSLKDVAWTLTAPNAATGSRGADPSAHPALTPSIHESVLLRTQTGELYFDQSKDAQELTEQGVQIGRLSTIEFKGGFDASVFSDTRVNVQAESDVFADRARALDTDPSVVLIPRQVQLTRPIRIVHDSAQGAASVVIVLESGASASVIEELVTTEPQSGTVTPTLFTGLTTIHASENSTLRYVLVQGAGENVQPFLRQRISADRGATIDHVGVFFGGSKGQCRIDAVCAEPGSTIRFKECSRLDKTQHHDFWIHARHDTHDTSSTVDCWTVAADQSRSVFNGNLVITARGVRTDAYQRNRNLMLSRRAVVDTIPKLEIATDDVKCAHGATISTVNPDQLYYLQSRGIARPEAEAMVIQGFTEPVVSLIPSPELRERVASALAKKAGSEQI